MHGKTIQKVCKSEGFYHNCSVLYLFCAIPLYQNSLHFEPNKKCFWLFCSEHLVLLKGEHAVADIAKCLPRSIHLLLPLQVVSKVLARHAVQAHRVARTPSTDSSAEWKRRHWGYPSLAQRTTHTRPTGGRGSRRILLKPIAISPAPSQIALHMKQIHGTNITGRRKDSS